MASSRSEPPSWTPWQPMLCIKPNGVHLTLLLLFGCGGPQPQRASSNDCDPSERFPIQPCPSAAHPERAGVWQAAGDDYAIVYDGCEVRFSELLQREHAPLAGLRNIARATVVDVRDYGDPAPFYRTASEWRGPLLCSVSILYDDAVARWDGSGLRTASGPLVRVTAVDELGDAARALLCVDRVVPTEEQLAREMGLPMRERRGPPDAIGDILCPTDDCAAP